MNSSNITAAKNSPEIKICGITREDDLGICDELGVDYVGFNFFSESKRFVEPTEAVGIWQSFSRNFPKSELRLVLVTVDSSFLELQMLARLFPDAFAVQLHGKETAAFAEDCRKKLTPKIWKALPVTETVMKQIDSYARVTDKILLDSSVIPTGSRVPGGSGVAFDWSAYSGLIARDHIGVAGGIHPGNISDLLRYNPKFVDVASGAEASVGIKSRDRILELISACRRAS